MRPWQVCITFAKKLDNLMTKSIPNCITLLNLLCGVGAVFAAINGGMIAYRSFVTKRVEQLLQHGQLIQAKFQQVEINTSIQVNGASPFRVVAQWHDTRNNEVRVYKSANLWFNPAQFVEDRTIPVYVDLNNPTKYHMDLSFLPKVTGLA